jgi:hypothetical protein
MAGGYFIFQVAGDGTKDAAITWKNALRIIPTGLVGVGNLTNPLHALHVSGNIRAAVGNMGVSNSATAPTAEWYLYCEANKDLYLKDNISGTYPLQIAFGATSSSLKILTGGNISIGGITTPTASATPSYLKLDNSYSNGISNSSLKIYLHNDGTSRYGLGVGSSGDIQYHSQIYHDFYIDGSLIGRFSASGLKINYHEVWHAGNLTNTLTNYAIPKWNGSALGNSSIVDYGAGNGVSVDNNLYCAQFECTSINCGTYALISGYLSVSGKSTAAKRNIGSKTSISVTSASFTLNLSSYSTWNFGLTSTGADYYVTFTNASVGDIVYIYNEHATYLLFISGNGNSYRVNPKNAAIMICNSVTNGSPSWSIVDILYSV